MNKRQWKKWYKKQTVYTKVCIGMRNPNTSFEQLTKVAIKVVDETLGLKGVVLVDSRDDETE